MFDGRRGLMTLERTANLMLLLGAAMAPSFGQRECTVTIRVVDFRGREIPAKIDVLKSPNDGQNFRERFDGMKVTVPCGAYDLVVRPTAPGIPDKISRRVFMGDADLLIVEVREDDEGPSAMHVSGRVEPMPSANEPQKPLRIKLSSLVNSGQHDALVDPSGGFLIYGWIQGPYVLTVLREEEILYTQAVLFDRSWGKETVVVKLPPKPPEVMQVRGQRPRERD
jgi:hypothetical protein